MTNDMKAGIEVTGLQMVQGGDSTAVEEALKALVDGGGSVDQERAWDRDATRFILDGPPELVHSATAALMAFVRAAERPSDVTDSDA